MERKYSGKVGYAFETIYVGGIDIIDELMSWKGQAISLDINEQRFYGVLYVMDGSPSYSEWTPGDQGEITLTHNDGVRDIFDLLGDLDGQEVTLFVSDELPLP